MVSALLSRLVILVFGLLYPAYASYKAVKTKNVKEYVKWMMYWIVFALFCAVEIFSDVFLSWCPFYYEVKMIFVFWLLSPVTKGSSFLYKKFIHPQLSKREKEIDEAIALARTRGYSTLMTLGHKGLTYATNVVVTTAMKDHVYLQGQTTLVEHIKKSYSTNDLRIHPARGGTDDIDGAMIIDSDEEFEDRLLQDNHELDNRDIEVRRTHKKRLREHNSLMRSNSDATDIRLRRMGKTNSALSRLEEADHEHSITDDVATEKDDTNKEEGMQETVTEEIIYYSPRKAGHYTSKEVKSDPYATLPRTRSRQRPRLNQH